MNNYFHNLIAAVGDVSKHHCWVYVFETQNGNPNGDPDAGGRPRYNPISGLGEVTKVCMNRKVRDYVSQWHGENIYVEKGAMLHNKKQEIADVLTEGVKDPLYKEKALKEACLKYWDVKAFGGVLVAEKEVVNFGHLLGPIHMNDAESYHRVDEIIVNVSITCSARTKDEKQGSQFGNYYKIPYALYHGEGWFDTHAASCTGFGNDDLLKYWEGLVRGWELDKSSMRGKVNFRRLYIWTHDNPMGNEFSQKLFDTLKVSSKKPDGEIPLSFDDYEITIDKDNIPEGITLTELDMDSYNIF
jgi:CRISPR-associated protein Csd2